MERPPPTGACAADLAEGYVDSALTAVEASVFFDDGTNDSGVLIERAQSDSVASLGPGSYALSQAASFGDCNPCVVAMSGSETGDLTALATAGTLRIDALVAGSGGRFAGEVTGLQVAEVDGDGPVGSCPLSVPDTRFDVTLEVF